MNIAYKASVFFALISLATLLTGAIMENWLMLVSILSCFLAVWLDRIGWDLAVREFHKR